MIYYLLGTRLTESTSNTFPDGAVPLSELQYNLAKLIKKHGYFKLKHELQDIWWIMCDEMDKIVGNKRIE